MLLLGYDIGSSSIKAALVDGSSNQVIHQTHYPEQEMKINSPHPGWAEQDPEVWWDHVISSTMKLLTETRIEPELIKGIGISYQMHGLVLVDENQQVLRPSIIWCDSRAVSQGERAFQLLGKDYCYDHLCNAPGNFTAAKLLWVKENEPQIYERIYKIMLPGDFIVMKMTGVCATTPSGLSEGIFWDFKSAEPDHHLLEALGFEVEYLPLVTPCFSQTGTLTAASAGLLGLSQKTIVSYRAGDQPNNALSLGVLQSGQVAGTGGTSGVIYGVHDQHTVDRSDRVNTFAHVNYSKQLPMLGVLLCINGAGSMYRWIRQQIANPNVTYQDLEEMLSGVPVGSDGVAILPFGNGAERMLGNIDPGAQITGIQFNRHEKAHLIRAGLEGIAFAFAYGIEIMKELHMPLKQMRVGKGNLFQSRVFSQTISNLMNGTIEMVDTSGAIGAARAVGYTLSHFSTLDEAFLGDPVIQVYEPQQDRTLHQEAFRHWKNTLSKTLTA